MTIDPDLVRQARLRAGLSLAQVGGSELTRQAVHLIETGKVRPSARSLQVIARRLGVPAQSFQVADDPGTDLPDGAGELKRLSVRERHVEVVALARQLLTGDGPRHLKAVAHLHLGLALNELGRPEEALGHARRARTLFEEERDPWAAAEAREAEAGALYLKDDPRAVAVGEDALHRYQALEPRRADVEARMLEHLATCLVWRRDYVRAMRCYTEALHVAGAVLDLGRLGRIYHGLGRCHYSLGDVRRAIDLASRAAALYAVENDLRPVPARTVLPRVENDLGMLLMFDGQLDRADELFESALRHLDETGLQRMRSQIMLSLAELRLLQGRTAESRELIEQAIDLAGRLDERAALAAGFKQLGELHARQREHELADRSFERALAILTEAGMAGQKAACLAAYERVREARGEATGLERSAG